MAPPRIEPRQEARLATFICILHHGACFSFHNRSPSYPWARSSKVRHNFSVLYSENLNLVDWTGLPSHRATSRSLSARSTSSIFTLPLRGHGTISRLSSCTESFPESQSVPAPGTEADQVWGQREASRVRCRPGMRGRREARSRAGLPGGFIFFSWQTPFDLCLFILLGRVGRSRAGECARSSRALSSEHLPRGVPHAGPQALEQTIFRNRARHQRRTAGA